MLHESGLDLPFVLLTTDVPAQGSAAASALATVRGTGRPVCDVVELLAPADHDRLRQHAAVGRDAGGSPVHIG